MSVITQDTALSGAAKTLELEIKALLDTNERIADTQFQIKGENVYVPEEAAADFRANLAKAREKKTLLDDLRLGTSMVDFMATDPETKSAAVRAAANSGVQQAAVYSQMTKDLGTRFTDSEEFKALRASGGLTMTKAWEVHGEDVTKMSTKDVYGGMSGTTFSTIAEGFGGRQLDPMVPRNFRRARVRDLFPVARTSSNLIDFFRVLGFGTNRLDLSSSASMVPDYKSGAFGLKPKSALKFETAQAPVRTIAHWEAAHRNVLADEPQLQSTINNELLYGLRLTEDAQILNGTGTSEDLLGILVTPGIQTYAGSSGVKGDQKQDTLRRALTKVILAYFDATGIVIHPSDWEDIETSKGEDGHYSVTMNVTIGAESRLWSVPVVDSPAIEEGTALVGAFGLGAQLYDRQEANIRVAEQHEDFFVRNAVVILAEQRLALAVKRPESFVKVTFAGVPT